MRTTIDIPDTLYRQVKSRSAMCGETMRTVLIRLFTGWVNGEVHYPEQKAEARSVRERPTWYGCLGGKINPTVPHDMDAVRTSVAAARKRGGQ